MRDSPSLCIQNSQNSYKQNCFDLKRNSGIIKDISGGINKSSISLFLSNPNNFLCNICNYYYTSR